MLYAVNDVMLCFLKFPIFSDISSLKNKPWFYAYEFMEGVGGVRHQNQEKLLITELQLY